MQELCRTPSVDDATLGDSSAMAPVLALMRIIECQPDGEPQDKARHEGCHAIPTADGLRLHGDRGVELVDDCHWGCLLPWRRLDFQGRHLIHRRGRGRDALPFGIGQLDQLPSDPLEVRSTIVAAQVLREASHCGTEAPPG